MNLDAMIQIERVNIRGQLADILTTSTTQYHDQNTELEATLSVVRNIFKYSPEWGPVNLRGSGDSISTSRTHAKRASQQEDDSTEKDRYREGCCSSGDQGRAPKTPAILEVWGDQLAQLVKKRPSLLQNLRNRH